MWFWSVAKSLPKKKTYGRQTMSHNPDLVEVMIPLLRRWGRERSGWASWKRWLFAKLWKVVALEQAEMGQIETGQSGWAAKTWNLLCLSQILRSSDPSTIEASNFQTDKKTRFIIHGFRDKGDESWLVAMCKVGPGSNPVACATGICPSFPWMPPPPFMQSQWTWKQETLTYWGFTMQLKCLFTKIKSPFHISGPHQQPEAMAFAMWAITSTLSFLIRSHLNVVRFVSVRLLCIPMDEGLCSFCSSLSHFPKSQRYVLWPFIWDARS